MHLLITAFDPFGGADTNTAMLTLEKLQAPCGVTLTKQVLPTVFFRSADLLWETVQREQPDAVICLGEAGGRARISLERIAVNRMDARIPDNSGYQPKDLPLVPDGPDTYRSSLPLAEMFDALKQGGFDAEFSDSAGTFVCNSLMYLLLYKIHAEKPGLPGGFIHVPAGGDPDRLAEALSTALAVFA